MVYYLIHMYYKNKTALKRSTLLCCTIGAQQCAAMLFFEFGPGPGLGGFCFFNINL